VKTYGVFAEQPLRPVVMAATKGLLAKVLEGGVSYVNSLTLAGERGIKVDEGRSNEISPYAGLVRLTLKTDRGEATVAGTLFTPDRPRLVEVDGVSIESRPRGHLLFLRNRDVPGVVGQIGTMLGRAKVNIAGFQLGRPSGGDVAVSIIDVDSEVPADVLAEIENLDEVVIVKSVSV
jgi:D-3-phosphoglycerate dehydrogenase